MQQIDPTTPQKPLPGAFLNTPAPARQQSAPFPLFRPSQPTAAGVASAPTNNANSLNFNPAGAQSASALSVRDLAPVERAARTVNATLDEESRYPALDSYVSQGSSNDYDITSSSIWAPFGAQRPFEIPEKILEQYNQAQVSTMMGLFADIHHAWISIDNALYLWDYKHPNPDVLGFEEQPNSIRSVKLVRPAGNVFIDSISRLLIVATTSDIYLIGVAVQENPDGAAAVSLYQTRMQVSVKGVNVSCIAGSDATGRVFFGGASENDLYELFYQKEEKWFQSRCYKINHTGARLQAMIPSLSFAQRTQQEHIVQIEVDDSRRALYTLSSKSTVRIFNMKEQGVLELSLTRTLSNIFYDLGHRVTQNPLLSPSTTIISICTIAEREASRLNLVATTNTGCRIYFSAVVGNVFGSTSSSVPTSMQVHHVRFPPPESSQQAQIGASVGANDPSVGTNGHLQNSQASMALKTSRLSSRFAPGYFFCFVQKDETARDDELFISSPDTGRIAHPQDASQINRFPEFGMWVPLRGRAEDIGLVSRPFGAGSTPRGFGNELAVQFDQGIAEVAILTNNGVHTFRRRRLVDVFTSMLKHSARGEGLETEVRKLIRLYGRGETVATAVAVACGQGTEISSTDSRMTKVTDPDVLDQARRVFIDFGGKPGFDENSSVDRNSPSVDDVRPSPRHEGLMLYISRLVRSAWKSLIICEKQSPRDGLQITPNVPLAKLQLIQRDLSRLKEFLDTNASFIEGLSGPEGLSQVSTKQDEVALQGEHRAMLALLKLLDSVVEGLSFVLVLFDEKISEIFMSLSEDLRQQMRQITFEKLFCSKEGSDIAKELVKAIVARNIASGSVVDSVTDALRRRCGTFCSPDDCIIFKAQEQLKRASDKNASSETSRSLLNESVRLLKKVAGSLSREQLNWAVEQYVTLEFFAGAVQLCLSVAHEQDKADRALAWVREGSPGSDDRSKLYQTRANCYALIYRIITAVDQAPRPTPSDIDTKLISRRQDETYEVINSSQDELFQFSLYDWYLNQGWSDRLLQIRTPYVISYLQQKSQDDVFKADLLWRYYAHYHNFLEAAQVQVQLAQSNFDLTLERRIEYLSFARANASTKPVGLSEFNRSRQTRQELTREVSDLLDLAHIQIDLLQRIKNDSRVSDERRPLIVAQLDGQIMAIDELYNGFADQASYYDICIIIYQIADHRNPSDIQTTWQSLLFAIHREAETGTNSVTWEAVALKVREMGMRLNLSETTFPIATLVPMLERYSYEYQKGSAPANWVVDLFMELGVPHETVVSALEAMFYAEEAPFHGRNRIPIARDLVHVVERWYAESSQMGLRNAFGGEENAAMVGSLLKEVGGCGLGSTLTEKCEAIRGRIDVMLR